jgi:hypothetical protein
MNIAVSAAVTGRRKRTLLPLLVVLFLISYCLLTTLVVEQNKTIDSQRTLIHLLFKDSLHLSALRKAERQKAQLHPGPGASVSSSQGKVRVPSAKIPVIQVPSTQIPSEKVSSEKAPSIQVPLAQVPSAQVPSGKTNAKTRRKGKTQKQMPNRPPAELTDPSDMRRVWFAI